MYSAYRHLVTDNQEMKKHKVLILLFLISCSTAKDLSYNSKYSDKELTPFQTDNKWGYADADGNVIIKPKYDSVGFFYNDIAKVKLKNKYGLIRKDNSYLIKPKYKSVDEFHNNYSQIIKGNKSKYIDSKGETITNTPLKGGYCWGPIVSIYKGVATKINGKYELVYERRKRIDSLIVMTYDTTRLKADTIIDYSNDYIQIVRNGKIGITKFNQINPVETTIEDENLKYDSIVISKYLDGATRYSKVREDNFWGIINEQGFETVKPKYKRILTNPSDIRNPIAVTDKAIYQNHKKLLVEYESGKLGYIDIYGNEYYNR